MKKNNDLGLLIVRISVGLLMLLHGIGKMQSIDFVQQKLLEGGLSNFLSYGVYVTQVIAPILLLIGYRTRIGAALFIFGTLFAMFLVHSTEIFTLTQHGGWSVELLGLYTFGAVALLFTGSGKYAVSSTHQWD
ncbi:DoxX family protein [Cellulophaga baltica]|uniref:DoxX family protein n=1 Tax=Cellulophaga baltica TaxID=76594 RepID=UPI00042A0318|nr:DoxX family protein [Cellulophaga baltica]AIY14538.1 DoxX family protein [Cellulophaga baltica NN016038]